MSAVDVIPQLEKRQLKQLGTLIRGLLDQIISQIVTKKFGGNSTEVCYIYYNRTIPEGQICTDCNPPPPCTCPKCVYYPSEI